jgi:hypothetical protein
MPLHHTQHVEYQGSFCRLPQGTLTDVSEYEQDTTLMKGGWAWKYSWMDLFYILFGSSSHFEKGIVIIFHALNHKHMGHRDRHLCARLPAMYCKMHDILCKIGDEIEKSTDWSSFIWFFDHVPVNPGIMVMFYAAQESYCCNCLAADMHVRWCNILEDEHVTSWEIGRCPW